MLKRYEDHELGESASRRVSYHCTTDYAKSSKATCRQCNRNIDQNELRLALMLQDEEGYKSTAWMHFDCFWKHPETKKLDGTHEIYNFSKLTPADRKRISASFENMNASKTTRKRKAPSKKNADDDSQDEEDFVPNAKSNVKKRTKKNTTSTKRKRESDDD